ncbi:MAG TPA: aldolase/citrate lyase family protein [Xanthobacteraceae bacterium]|nr:aldolase/citrate lyase family protein [Xanthobacteraceae bacterium]
MAELPRLNGVIGALENGGHAFTAFCPTEITSAQTFGASKYDGIVFEGEHQPWDARQLRDCFQYTLNRKVIIDKGSVAQPVTPMVRVPVNGAEKSQWLAKQALDLGAFGIVWPHISTVEEAYNAVAACRYPRTKDKPLYEPQGLRGDGPHNAVRFWGISQQEYYQRADVWPLAPHGEIFVIIQIEDWAGVKNLPDMLKNVPGIGAILPGEGDISQEMGYPRQYEHPEVLARIAEIVSICKQHNVIVGHPHVEAGNAERLVNEGFRFLMCAPTTSYPGLDKAKAAAAALKK